MRIARKAWVLFVGLSACFRSDLETGIEVRVVHEIRTVNVDESETVSRVPGAGAVVALAPVDTHKSALAEIDSGWVKRAADVEGAAGFEAADEIMHVLVDLDGDGLVDGRALHVVPGHAVTVVVTGTAAGEGEWLKAETDKGQYAPGERVEIRLEGYVASATDVTLEIWHEGDKRKQLADLKAGRFAGDVSKETSSVVAADWPLSSAQRLDDYLVVPRAHGRYYEGARFSVRKATVPVNMSALGLTINGGVTVTTVRTVTLTPSGKGVARVAFSENKTDFPSAASKLLFTSGDPYPFLLSSGDGRKTVWAMFFDADDNYAGPVSASILLDTALYPTPITGISFKINYGASVTLSSAVRLQAHAYGAQTVAFADDPTVFLVGPLKFPANLANYGYMLPGTNGVKTVWAQFYDANGFYSAPVSATIRLEEGLPLPADPARLYVITHPPGQQDELGGYAGAVGAFDPVVVYVDRYESRVLAQGTANADGSFGPWLIADGSAGNVEEPQDLVYVVRTDMFDRRSMATAITNDSTAPWLYQEHLTGTWFVDTKGHGVGNKGDVFQAQLNLAAGFGPADEIVGGIVNFGGMGGPTFVVAGRYDASMYAAYFTVPNSANLDSDFLRYRARVSDAAGNLSGWITSYGSFSIDTIPPKPVNIADYGGGNREFWVTWNDPNLDSFGGYVATFENEHGDTFDVAVDLFEYCAATGYAGNTCLAVALFISGGSTPSGFGGSAGPYTFANITNCHWYTVRIRAIDNGGNEGQYSTPVSDRVILPPPEFQSWGTFSQGGSGALAYSMASVTNASGYELYFDVDSGAPYSYTTSTGKVSPLAVTIAAEPYVQRLNGFPLRTNVYLSARALDGTCKSDYAAEMTVATDLRLEATADGNPGETIGGALAAANDLDLDGVPDLLVGATLGGFIIAASGGGGAAPISSFGSYLASEAYDLPGRPLAAADIDGDGKDEYLVGSPVDTFGGKQLAGSVRVYDDNFTLLATLGKPVEGLHLGFAVANIGDRNGDGKDDFIAGGFGCAHRDCAYDPYTGEAGEGPGVVIVYDGATLTALATVPGPLAGDYFGAAIAGGSDLNGDGVGDIAVGAPGSPSLGSQGVGIVDGKTGSTLGLVPAHSWRFGSALAFIPDIDGDGVDDLIVGSPGRTESGTVFAISSKDWKSVLWQQDGSMTLTPTEFGGTIATGGDINGDGEPDVVVGAPPRIQNYYYGAGAAYVLDGKTGRFLYELTSSAVDGAIGYAVLSPGNLNAGSRDEWVVGAPGTSQGGAQAGRVYILTTDP